MSKRHQQNEEQNADWGAVYGADMDVDFDDNDDEDFSQDLSAGTDLSPVDVAAFPSSSSSSNNGKSSRRHHRIGQDVECRSMEDRIASRLSLPASTRRSTVSGGAKPSVVGRLPRKSRSLEGSAKAAVAAIAAKGVDERRSVRRTKSDMQPSKREQDAAASAPRRGGRRHGGRRSSTDHSTNSDNSNNSQSGSRRSNSRRSTKKEKEQEESPAERVQRLRELGLAYKAANILEKSVGPKTEHLKKDVLM